MFIKDRPEYKSKPRPLCYPPETKVLDAAREMSERGFGSVIVTNPDDTIAGIVTERDLMRKVIARGGDPEKLTLADIMTRDVKAARESDNLVDWLRQMSNDRFRHLPVIDDDGKVKAMMSQGDFVSYTWPELLNRIGENAKATLKPNYQIALIIGAILVYSLLVPLVYRLF